MPSRGSPNHLAITVSDIAQSEQQFYEPVLRFLGYEKVEDLGHMTLWWSAVAGMAINIWQAKLKAVHDRAQPGFHHFAFSATSRDDVNAMFKMLTDRKIAILDAPAEYPHYAPDYYAVYFADPDGLKYEFAFMTPPA